MARSELTEDQRAMLDFERDWNGRSPSKDEAIRLRFSLTPARYYQVLGSVIETEAALRYDPILVKRLLRMQEDRRRARDDRLMPPTGS